MKLVFVRHGETDWNKEKRRMGRADIPLNEAGLAQAQKLTEMIEPDFDALYSSPLKRAHETAQAIAARFGKEITIKVDLTERDFGTLQGKVWAEMNEITGEDIHAAVKAEQYDFRPYGGESAEDLKVRLLKFLAELKKESFGKVVIVCHSGVISMMHHLFPGNESGPITNTSIHEFTFD